MAFKAREDPSGTSAIQLLLPPENDLDAVLGTEKWLVRQAQSEALGLNAATQVAFVGPDAARLAEDQTHGDNSGCKSTLEW